MIGFEVYKLIHLVGLFCLFAATGMLHYELRSGRGEFKAPAWFGRGGLFLMLLGGFGMMARLHMSWVFPGWILAKIALWVVAGALLDLTIRGRLQNRHTLWAFLAVGAIAGFLALWKPF